MESNLERNIYDASFSLLLREAKFLEDKIDVHGFSLKASKFTSIDSILYRIPTLGSHGDLRPYLRCLDKDDANTMLYRMDACICRNHIGGINLANKTLGTGYY